MTNSFWDEGQRKANILAKHFWDIAGMEWEFAEMDRKIKEHNQKCFVGTGSLWKDVRMTNFDKIKTMSMDDLIGFLLNVEYNNYDFTYGDDVKKWLLQEAE